MFNETITHNVKNVLSFGAGVQSTTVLLMSCEGLLPKLDHVIFADTQWEPSAVYRHLEWCHGFAASHGITIDVRTAGNLRDDIVDFWGPLRSSSDGKRHASIPAFIKNPDGSRGLVRRQCTSEYKIEVIEKYIRGVVLQLVPRQRWPLEHAVTQWLGISCDEASRMKRSRRPACKFWHPLIEADACAIHDGASLFSRGMTRADCLSWLSSRGYPRPPRSACIGCPFRSNAEWLGLTRDELADAGEVDALIRSGARERLGDRGHLVGLPYLHQSMIPLVDIDFSTADDNTTGFDDECFGICGV